MAQGVPGRRIEFEKSTRRFNSSLSLGQVDGSLLKNIETNRANHGSWLALCSMGLIAWMAIGCRVGLPV